MQTKEHAVGSVLTNLSISECTIRDSKAAELYRIGHDHEKIVEVSDRL